MRISFNDLSTGQVCYKMRESKWADDSGLTVIGTPDAEIWVTPVDATSAELEGKLHATVESCCSRCGRELRYRVSATYSYLFSITEELAISEQEIELSDEECNTVYLSEPFIDIDGVLQEQLILGVPEKLLCSESCKGLCQDCGAIIGVETCNCEKRQSNSPFAALKNYKR